MKRLSTKIIIAIAVFLLLWLIFDVVARIVVEVLWFKELDYLSVWWTRFQTQFWLCLFTIVISGSFLWGNLYLADNNCWQWLDNQGWVKKTIPYLKGEKPKLKKVGYTSRLATSYKEQVARSLPSLKTTGKSVFKLPLLLPLTIASCSAIAILTIYYTYLSVSIYRRDLGLNFTFNNFNLWLNSGDDSSIWPDIALWGTVSIIVILLLTKTISSLRAIATIISILFSCIVVGHWNIFLQFLNSTSFYTNDPQFGNDIGFYIFNLPLLNLLSLWINGLFACSLIIVFIYYLLSGNSLSEGNFPGFSRFQIRHLSILAGLVMVSMSFHHYLNRYDLLYYPRGVVYGAGFTDVHVQLPLEQALSLVAIMIAIWLLIKGFLGYKNLQYKTVRKAKIILNLLPVFTYALLVLSSNIGSSLIQRFVVLPNELVKETPYINRSIAMTRKGFGLDEIESKIFNPQGELTARDIQRNNLTIDNIRLWDIRPILQTNRQLQQIRLYYQFPDADIDRYILKEKTGDNKQQIIISARELDYSAVPERAKTWVNKHLVYTHGYGFTLSPVNRVDEGGLPYYFVKDIGADTGQPGSLNVSSPVIRRSIPITNPRIYYGELTDTYIMTGTKARELDFPSGEENVYTIYEGTGGIPLGNYGSRLLFAEYLKDWQMLFTQNFTPETKLLLRRNVVERVKHIAPWLRYDRDPYLVVADTETENGYPNHLYWIMDAYTTSGRYPYSDPGDHPFNYIRNSVKVVVDAYNGNVNFYIADPTDPIVLSWSKIFPQLFKILGEMPPSLRSHIRYPEDLFSILSERLLTYHMTDPQVFYNREDQWEIPQEIYGAEKRPVEPYYLIMRLPTAQSEEFILLHPYTPVSRPNLIAWLAARSDNEEYGKLLLYKFPKQRLIFGPNQIEALINQDPVISQQISLWTREGSKAIQGNLLIIPIQQSLLYVEPVYLEAAENSVPTLARVIVVYGNQIVMAESLDEAIAAIFQPQKTSDSAIIRPLETQN